MSTALAKKDPALSTNVGAPGDPYAFVAQMLKAAEPRVREAAMDLMKQIARQHEAGVQEFKDRMMGKTGFKKIGQLQAPTNPHKRAEWTLRRQLGIPDAFGGVVEHLPHPTRLEDSFIFADGDVVKIMTYGAQGGEVPPGHVRISTTALFQLDGGQDAKHVFEPVDVKL